MGIFDALKQVGNYLSGGGAKMQLVADTSKLITEGKVSVRIFCIVKDADILVDKLYLSLKAEETVRYRDHSYSGTQTGISNRHRGAQKTHKVKTYSQEIIIDENFRLEALGEYEWSSEFIIPVGIAGTYRGVNASHEWMVLAGLSKKGNDPDSGWVVFDV